MPKNKSTLFQFTCVLFLFMPLCHAQATDVSTKTAEETEIKSFFNDYLNTYNQRFGHPELGETFIESLQQLIHQPYMMSPPNSSPFTPNSKEQMYRIFDGFVQQLEQKGANQLAWKSVDVQLLSATKALANNHGYATNSTGEVVYETVSYYLLIKTDTGWKIALFSPYDLGHQ